jgi:hypothetical protein
MSSMSRRDFLKIAAYSSSAVLTSRLLAACAKTAEEAGPVHLVLGSYTNGIMAEWTA